ncbi:acyl carrier protein [Pseudocolwellia agarivorans]|uniref:acyl carrier protein n=1 Tax=Pseudocolwellia agarivorans TaxID=1911682 RepID=UPI000986184A|nr:acyl carrier protein [Pseudocolwellia agarivorans]
MNTSNVSSFTKAKIIDIVSEYTTEDLKQVSHSDSLDSIGIDSLSLVEIIFDLEEAFDINIPSENELEQQGFNLSSLDDVVTLVESLVQQNIQNKVDNNE